MRAALLALVLLALANCSGDAGLRENATLKDIHRQNAARADAKFLVEKAKFDGNVGKERWVKFGLLRSCRKPDYSSGSDCDFLVPGTHLTIQAVDPGIIQVSTDYTMPVGDAYYRFGLDDGRVLYAPAHLADPGTVATSPAQDQAECRRKGDPRVGMSAQQVEKTCWGKPDHVNRTTTAGVVSDQYVYGDDRYVYLRNGIVTSIQTSGRLR
jgi:hypothetical protein